GALSVDEGATIRINEFWVEFTLTPAQVEHEAAAEAAMLHGHGASTGISLATRAANILAQAEDTLIFQGHSALESPLFKGENAVVNNRAVLSPGDLGLLNIPLDGSQPALRSNQVIAVPPLSDERAASGQPVYQEHTVAAVSSAYSILQSYGHYGPYALV